MDLNVPNCGTTQSGRNINEHMCISYIPPGKYFKDINGGDTDECPALPRCV